MRSIATRLSRAPSTVCRELRRNGGARCYRAVAADKSAWERARRPKACKLATHPPLQRKVARLLLLNWSPEQIAGWLRRHYPKDEADWVSHETIYRSLFAVARQLNERPRKTLGYYSPAEKFSECVASIG